MNYDPNPKPLEETDKALADQIQLVTEGRHPTIQRIVVEQDSIRTYMRDGSVRTKKVALPGRNDPCYCGSGKKFKKCCLR